MHVNSQRIMGTILASYLISNPTKIFKVVDYGSMEHPAGPGTYRPFIAEHWQYIGCDLEAGPNVDLVMPGEYDTGLPDGVADIVISGQCLEHVRNPFKAVAEMARNLKPGGMMAIVVPFTIAVHRFPIDCWRFAPDGLVTLMEEAGVRTVFADVSDADCYLSLIHI